MSRALFGILISGHGHRFECGHCFNFNVLEHMICTGVFNPVAGFPPVGLSLSVLRSLLVLNAFSVHHCCEEPGRVFVWIVPAMTVLYSRGLLK